MLSRKKISLFGAILFAVWMPVASALAAGPAAAAPKSTSSPAAKAPAATDDFDLFGSAPPPPPLKLYDPEVQRRGELRHSMLKYHQIAGLTSFGLMAADCVVGQLNYNDLYPRNHAGTGNYIWPHRILSYGALAAFATTASLAIFAPSSYEKRDEIDPLTYHKVAVTGAALGMLSQAVIGFMAARYGDAGNPKDMRKYAQFHEIAGYSTTGMMAVAAAVWVF